MQPKDNTKSFTTTTQMSSNNFSKKMGSLAGNSVNPSGGAFLNFPKQNSLALNNSSSYVKTSEFTPIMSKVQTQKNETALNANERRFL